MEWHEAIRAFRRQKEAQDPKNFTIAACATRAGIPAANWSRMEAGCPKKNDGSSPSPTLHKLQIIACGLSEPIETVYAITQFAERSSDEGSHWLAQQLHPLLSQVSSERRRKMEEDIVTMARILISNAA